MYNNGILDVLFWLIVLLYQNFAFCVSSLIKFPILSFDLFALNYKLN